MNELKQYLIRTNSFIDLASFSPDLFKPPRITTSTLAVITSETSHPANGSILGSKVSAGSVLDGDVVLSTTPRMCTGSVPDDDTVPKMCTDSVPDGNFIGPSTIPRLTTELIPDGHVEPSSVPQVASGSVPDRVEPSSVPQVSSDSVPDRVVSPAAQQMRLPDLKLQPPKDQLR
jgi:hypothetical protein